MLRVCLFGLWVACSLAIYVAFDLRDQRDLAFGRGFQECSNNLPDVR